MDFNIRKIEPEDRNDFLEMSCEFYSSEAVMHSVEEEYHKRAFDELMKSETYMSCMIFETGGRIAGYALICKSYSREAGGCVVWIDELYVRPEFQGKGAAGMFFDWLEKNMPAARYRLEAEEDNFRAVKLYKKRGFEVLPYIQMYRDMGV